MTTYAIVNPGNLATGQPMHVEDVLANLQAIQAVVNGGIDDSNVAAANKDGVVGTASMRTLGAGAQQAMPGNRTLDAITAPAADVSVNTHKLTNVVDPTNAQDAATKNYVDLLTQGLSAKTSVHAATAGANIATLAGGAPNTLDGVTLAANDRVLVKDQTTANQNGIYIVTTLGTGVNGTWTRALDMDAWTEVPNAYVWVQQGTVNADTGWVCTADPGGTLGTTSITWVLFASAHSGPQPKITSQAFSSGPPASPADGDIWMATAVDANGTVWMFRYNVGSASALKWEFTGGPPLRVTVSAFESTTTTGSWVDTATVGPSYTPPRNGDYQVSYEADMNHSIANTKIQMGPAQGAGTPADNFAIVTPAGVYISGNRVNTPLNGWTGGNEIRCRYFSGAAGTLAIGNRTMLVTPVRVS